MTHLPHIRPLEVGLEYTERKDGISRLHQTVDQGEFLSPGSQSIGSVTINFGKADWGLDCVVRSEDEARKIIKVMMNAASEYLRTRDVSTSQQSSRDEP